MWVTPLELIQTLSRRMRVGWPKCGSDPRDEGHLACLRYDTSLLVAPNMPRLLHALTMDLAYLKLSGHVGS